MRIWGVGVLFFVGCASVGGGRVVLSDERFNDFVGGRGFVIVRFDAGVLDRGSFFEALKRLGRGVRGGVCPLSLCPKTVARYKIGKLPTYVLFKDGEVLTRRVGNLTAEEIEAWVRRHMEAVRVEGR